MKKNYFFNIIVPTLFSLEIKGRGKSFVSLLMGLFFLAIGHAQKGNSNKDVTPRACTEYIGNGLYRVNFGYDNPTNKVVTVNEEASFITHGNGKKKSKGPRNFISGTVNKAFTREFGEKDVVEWTVINPSGKQYTVTASANSSHCQSGEVGVIFPVYGQGDGKSGDIIGLELTALSEGTAGTDRSNIIYQIDPNEKVLIEIIPNAGKVSLVLDYLQNTFWSGCQCNLQYNEYDPNILGPQYTDFIVDPAKIISQSYATIDVFFPIANLPDLNLRNDIINFARPLYTPINQSDHTGVITEGDAAQRTDVVRQSFRTAFNGEVVPVDGNGIKVAVLSDSFDKQPASAGQNSKATVDVIQKDLPGDGNPNYSTPVQVLKDYPYGVASDEGRAMLQIIHDVAPGAALGFSTGVLSPRDLALAITNFSDLGYNIITDDITYPLEPFFGDGQISQAIRQFTAKPGNLYFTSAGNFANKGYQSKFASTANAPITNFLPNGTPARAHLFDVAAQDYRQKISVVPGTYMIVLQWAENLASQENSSGAATDLDIYLVSDTGELIVGNNRVNELGDPTEVIVFRATGSGTANIMITSANGAPPPGLAFRYIAFRTTTDGGTEGLTFMEYNQGAPTVSGHAMTTEAVAVGAVDQRVALNPSVQAFSSYAGALSNNTVLEVDISAPDGGDTSVQSIGQDVDGDNYKNFFGTSAAAPHAAGAFALMLSALPTWYPGGLPSEVYGSGDIADQALQLFKNTSVPAGSAIRAGSGLIDAEAAFKTIAAQTANLTGLVYAEGVQLGTVPFEVTIVGEFFPTSPTVIFDGQELEIISSSETEITALVGTFTGNPALVVVTDPITGPEGPDGGDSNPLFFFNGNKVAINIVAEEVAVEFGDAVNYSFRVEGLPEGATFDDTGLPEVVFAVPAATFPYPDVNNYTIVPSFGEVELTPEQLDLFQVNFINGNLNISKKNLGIRPENLTITYGDAVNVLLNYTYNEDNIDDKVGFQETISNSHDQDFFEDNTLILINKLRAVVNQQEILDLLNDGSWMASERIIQNKLRAVVNGEMNLVDLDVQNFDNYFDIEPIGNKLRAVVNKLRAVVNGQNLLNNQIDLLEPVTNKLRAVVNGTGILNENGFESFESIFAVVDFEDGAADDEEPRTVDKVYATNLLTGLDVTGDDGPSLVFPGAFLSAIANNFIITYGSGNIIVTPAKLSVQTSDLEIDYGTVLTADQISSIITGFVYNETIAEVFPSETSSETGEIPYYFVDENGTEFELDEVKALGSYQIKVRNPQNYTIDYVDPIGILQIAKKTLTVNSDPVEIGYGTVLTADSFTTVFDGFALGEDQGTVFPAGIPYYFVDSQDVRFEIADRLPVGVYAIQIDDPENYQIEYGENHAGVSVVKKTLTVNTTALVIEYGTALNGGDFSTSFDGFVAGEDVDDVFPLPTGIPYYLLVDGNRIELDAVRDVGSFEIRIDETETVPQNYMLVYDEGHGGVSITKKSLTVTTYSLEIEYGDYLSAASFNTVFDSFGWEDDADVVFNGALTYYLVEEGSGTRFEIDDPLEVGVYAIKIDETETVPQNYSLVYGVNNGKLTIIKKSLSLAFNDLVIDQGSNIDFSKITFKTGPTGYVYGDNANSVFGTPLPLFFEDAEGEPYVAGATGVFFIRINAPKNYFIAYTSPGVVYVNPTGNNVRKVRTYLDCVQENPGDPNGLIYIANYRYENPNNQTIYVLNGPENRITGQGQFSGTPPIAFLPGQGTFQIRFNGTIKWELITLDSNNKTASTSDASSTSNKCGSGSGSGDSAYVLYPNTVQTTLNIYQNVSDNSTVEIFNFYGVLYFTGQFVKNGPPSMDINMSYYPTGFYVVRMTSKDSVKVYSIVKG
jgi:hypothetical protein